MVDRIRIVFMILLMSMLIFSSTFYNHRDRARLKEISELNQKVKMYELEVTICQRQIEEQNKNIKDLMITVHSANEKINQMNDEYKETRIIVQKEYLKDSTCENTVKLIDKSLEIFYGNN